MKPDSHARGEALDTLAIVLDCLAGELGQDFGRAPIQSALDRTQPSDEEDDSVEAWVLRAASQLGFRAQANVDLADHPGPVLLSLSDDGTRWALLLERNGKHWRVSEVTGREVLPPRKVAAARLAQALGLPEGAPLRAIEMTPAAPCAGAAMPAGPGAVAPAAWKRLIKILQPDMRDVWTVVVFSVATGVLMLAVPIAVQALVNFVAFGGAVPSVVVVSLLLFLGLAFAAGLIATQAWIVEILQRRLFVRMFADLAARLPRVTMEARGHGYGPELVNRFFDVVTIQKAGSSLLLDGLGVLLSVLVGLVVLAFYHPLLLAFDVLLLAAIGLIVFGPVRRGIRTSILESKSKYAAQAWLEEIARNPIVFKTAESKRWVQREADRLARQYVDRRKDHYRIVFTQVVAALVLQAVASTALLGIGAWLVIQGSLTLGQLVAAELIVTTVVASFAKMGKHLEGFYDLMAAVDKVGQLLDLPLEPRVGEHPPVPQAPAELELKGVSWGPTRGRPFMQDLSLKVPAGSSLGVTGESGTGKSGLLELCWGARQPAHGSIRLNGRDLRELAPEYVRSVAYLTSQPEIVVGTIRDNVRLARRTVSDEDVRSALERVGLLDSIGELPKGLDTTLAPDGYPLSAGQAQSLALARAIAGSPRLLLFDGALDRLPRKAFKQALEVLFDSGTPWTLLVASESQEVLARCDRVLSLPDGSVLPGLQLEEATV